MNNSSYFTNGQRISREYLLPSNQDAYVSDLLDENVITITQDEDLAKAASLLTRYKISGLPVLDSNSKLVGVVSKTDIVRAFSDVIPHEQLRLKYKEMY